MIYNKFDKYSIKHKTNMRNSFFFTFKRKNKILKFFDNDILHIRYIICGGNQSGNKEK